uniref:Caspase-3 n=1 Tax=Penaeus japonicus TaxID=27405 RepID=A0A1C9CWM5_PENJP|nr:caspase-3 [Penaeus japonicus]
MSSSEDQPTAQTQRKDGRDGGNESLSITQEQASPDDQEPAPKDTSGRPTAAESMSSLSDRYSMNHGRRGDAVIFVHSKFEKKDLKPRKSASHDAYIMKEAFEALGFRAEEHWDLTKVELLKTLQQVAERDHSDCDSLVLVFMSHGGLRNRNNREYVWAKDTTMDTLELWVNFTAERCPKLAGKPKLYFIQACRGDDVDKGVNIRQAPVRGLAVQTDCHNLVEDYVIPLQADQLVMWASYPGYPSFRSMGKGIQGSVFIHYLANNLKEYAITSPRPSLASILLKVTREVAIRYESSTHPKDIYNKNKQVPYTHSTLLREVYF